MRQYNAGFLTMRCAFDILELIMETADALVDSGLRDLGYVYLNLDGEFAHYHAARRIFVLK